MIRYFTLLSFVVVASCGTGTNQPGKIELNETEAWELTYRMFASSILEKDELGIQQFDSLLNSTAIIEPKVLNLGLEMLHKEGQREKLIEIFKDASEEAKIYVCRKGWISAIENPNSKGTLCSTIDIEEELPSAPDLQKDLVIMYYNDQTIRGADKSELAKVFNLDMDSISYNSDEVSTDATNREKLKNILAKHGFPTKAMVGDVGMRAIFIVIQHADQDKEFQQSQFPHLENAVKNGDLDGQSYAYLYDRIKINAGEPQLYGTQCSNIDRVNNSVELFPVEDIEGLDKRRMEMDMMPIQTYKELLLSPPSK